MNCQNCGAPMTLFPERGYFFCEYCKSYYFPSESADGVRLLGKAPEKIQCAVCHVRLLIASFDGEHHGYFCEKCKGILLSRESFVETLASRWHGPPNLLSHKDLLTVHTLSVRFGVLCAKT